jgi:hypothetical protein
MTNMTRPAKRPAVRRNGNSKKTIKGEFGNIDIAVPPGPELNFRTGDRSQRETRFTGFDDKIISMYARGMTTRDIQAHLQELYGIGLCQEVGCQPSDDCQVLAEQLGADHPAVLLSARDPKGHLHDERHRITQHVAPEGDEEPGFFSERRGHDETAILGHEKYLQRIPILILSIS